MNKDKSYYMKKAFEEAKKAYEINEVPVGAIIVKDNEIIAKAFNKRENNQQCTAHAELLAIQKASKKMNSWRLDGCELYVTLEPCLMCAGTIMQARIKKVYYGATDSKAGVIESITNVQDLDFCHKVEYEGGIEKEMCSKIIKEFFMKLREKKKNEKDN
ncbi:MAG: tRNA adenosine(34) deaminase TadA [Clostridia bacterium]